MMASRQGQGQGTQNGANTAGQPRQNPFPQPRRPTCPFAPERMHNKPNWRSLPPRIDIGARNMLSLQLASLRVSAEQLGPELNEIYRLYGDEPTRIPTNDLVNELRWIFNISLDVAECLTDPFRDYTDKFYEELDWFVNELNRKLKVIHKFYASMKDVPEVQQPPINKQKKTLTKVYKELYVIRMMLVTIVVFFVHEQSCHYQNKAHLDREEMLDGFRRALDHTREKIKELKVLESKNGKVPNTGSPHLEPVDYFNFKHGSTVEGPQPSTAAADASNSMRPKITTEIYQMFVDIPTAEARARLFERWVIQIPQWGVDGLTKDDIWAYNPKTVTMSRGESFELYALRHIAIDEGELRLEGRLDNDDGLGMFSSIWTAAVNTMHFLSFGLFRCPHENWSSINMATDATGPVGGTEYNPGNNNNSSIFIHGIEIPNDRFVPFRRKEIEKEIKRLEYNRERRKQLGWWYYISGPERAGTPDMWDRGHHMRGASGHRSASW